MHVDETLCRPLSLATTHAPAQLFRYFATVSCDGEVFMTADDFLRSIINTGVQPTGRAANERAIFLTFAVRYIHTSTVELWSFPWRASQNAVAHGVSPYPVLCDGHMSSAQLAHILIHFSFPLQVSASTSTTE